MVRTVEGSGHFRHTCRERKVRREEPDTRGQRIHWRLLHRPAAGEQLLGESLRLRSQQVFRSVSRDKIRGRRARLFYILHNTAKWKHGRKCKLEDAPQDKHTFSLKEEIIRLGPWHLEVQVTPEISTRAFLEAPAGTYPSERVDSTTGRKHREMVAFRNPRKGFVDLLQKVYPDGLEGRTFLDCACNCGAYSFFAKELGASACFGFDVREHWINQARFLAANRTWPSDGIRFETLDLYDLPELGLKPFDITLFQGIFYHLPDPIRGLKVAADLTRELIIVDTAMRNGLPDGMLAIAREGSTQLMTGVYGLNWHPTGPNVLIQILSWLGFAETRVVRWRANHREDRPDIGRLRILASRKEGLLEKFESLESPS